MTLFVKLLSLVAIVVLAYPASTSVESAMPDLHKPLLAQVADTGDRSLAKPYVYQTTNPPEQEEPTKKITGKVSWYGESDKTCRGCIPSRITACGEKFREDSFTLASNVLPCGTMVIISKANKRIIATTNDTGGFHRYNRIADLSKATFAALAPLSEGIITVTIEILE